MSHPPNRRSSITGRTSLQLIRIYTQTPQSMTVFRSRARFFYYFVLAGGGGRRSISVGTAIERAPFLPTARTAKK